MKNREFQFSWDTGERRPRIGAVSYLNSKPLVVGLADCLPSASIRLDLPSRLATDLSEDRLDVALIPSIEYFRGDHYAVFSDACVAARGPVMSVKVYFRVPPGRVQTLALDEGSRTSAALAQLLLAEKFGVFPRKLPLPLSTVFETAEADAVLVIGDRAMHAPQTRFVETWDLGEEWFEWTGLPFVFALWAGPAQLEDFGVDVAHLDEALGDARDRGVGQIPEIVRTEAPRLGLSNEVAYDYLTSKLHFTLGSAERNGLKLFYQLASQLDLAPKGVELAFRSPQTARTGR